MTAAKAYGKVLKQQRMRRKLTQLELAERSELDVTYISLLERGLRQPTLKTILSVAKALDMAATEMIRQTVRLVGKD